MIPHCTACAADAEVAHEGCGDPSCCGPTYCLPCGCARGEVCTLEGDNSDCAGCAAYNAELRTPHPIHETKKENER